MKIILGEEYLTQITIPVKPTDFLYTFFNFFDFLSKLIFLPIPVLTDFLIYLEILYIFHEIKSLKLPPTLSIHLLSNQRHI